MNKCILLLIFIITSINTKSIDNYKYCTVAHKVLGVKKYKYKMVDKYFAKIVGLDTLGVFNANKSENDDKALESLSKLYNVDIKSTDIYNLLKYNIFNVNVYESYRLMSFKDILLLIDETDNFMYFKKYKMLPFLFSSGDLMCYSFVTNKIYYAGVFSYGSDSAEDYYIPIYSSLNSMFKCGLLAIDEHIFYFSNKGIGFNSTRWFNLCKDIDGSAFWKM